MLCDSCGTEQRKLLKKPEWYLCDVCTDGKMQPQLPRSLNTMTMETKDAHRGKSLPKNHKEKMTKRMNEHHDRHEAERKIDEFGIDDARRLGWDKRVKRV